ncbi:MAG: hypothetical protein LBT32_09075, partial [Peptococcaceae bacterium]|nr:hypothetical protein [Peptococcaceae bacterium]
KAFSEQDVRHAADKVISVGKPQMNFVMGRHGSYDEDEIKECVTEYLQKGFIINVTPVNPFVLTLLLLIEDIDIDRYVRYILQTAIDTKFKEETISFIRNTADEQFGEILVD